MEVSSEPCVSRRMSSVGDVTSWSDNSKKIDFVLVYKEEDSNDVEKSFVSDAAQRRRFFEENLRKAGLELDVDRVKEQEKTLVFVKVHLPFSTLCKEAERLHIKSPLWIHDKHLVKNSYSKQKSIWRQLFSCRSHYQMDKKPRMYGSDTAIDWPFKRKHKHRYAIRNEETFFTEKQRIEIAYEILQHTPNNQKELKRRGIQVCLEENVYQDAFPLHDGDLLLNTNGTNNDCKPKYKSERRKLKETWASLNLVLHLQPFMKIRNYFGEKIAFYFAFMDLYVRMLVFPSLFGVVTFIIGMITTISNSEIYEICTKSIAKQQCHPVGNCTMDEVQVDSLDVADLHMCPICRPPGCGDWQMIPDGCFQYIWAFRLDNPCSFVLSAFTSLWAIIFLKMWKRRESYLAAEWGTEDVEELDTVIRPEYEERSPSRRKNPVTLEFEPYIPLQQELLWLSTSIFATVMYLLFACLCLILLVLSRIKLYSVFQNIHGLTGHDNVELARWLVHGFIFIVAAILENTYNYIVEKLTDYECPKTQKLYLNSLLWKLFIFQILNEFIPIVYAAWIKGKTVRTPLDMGAFDELCDGGCMGEVTELVAVLLLIRLILGNITEIAVPFLKNAWNRFFRMQKPPENNSRIAQQYVSDYYLNKVDIDGVYEEYMEMIIQFAFIVLFVPALPVAPFVCLLNNILEIRVDAVKLLQANRRPLPTRVSSIGIWNRFLDIISKLGIICNAGLLAFTSDNIPRLYYHYKYQPDQWYHGFTKFSLSKIHVKDYGPEDAAKMLSKNITECFYPDFRESFYPFELKQSYWEILSIRLIVFSVYCIFFFILMWSVNTFVGDVPERVRNKIQRKKHLVAKAVELEATFTKVNEINNDSTDDD